MPPVEGVTHPQVGWRHWMMRKPVVLGLITVVVVLLFLWPSVGPTRGRTGGGTAPGLRGIKSAQYGKLPSEVEFVIIADLDKESKQQSAGKPQWHSILKKGVLRLNKDGKYSVTWTTDIDLVTKHAEAGRGMELSELTLFNGVMYTFDDRSGIVFEVDGYDTNTPKTYPRYILTEGDGRTDKGLKIEWATVKDDLLYIGSFGKEYTDNNGGIVNRNNLWIKTVDAEGRINTKDWSDNYNALRKKTGTEFPGYLLHEAVVYSATLNKWLLFPRRVSTEAYEEIADETRGSNMLLIADETFTEVEERRITTLVPERGFSSVVELLRGGHAPTTHVVALRSAEDSRKNTQTSFLSVLSLENAEGALMQEVEVPGGHKFEGIEILKVTYE